MLEYELATLKPSQERRLVVELSSEPARMRFIAKLKKYLARDPRVGADWEATELAMRLSSLNIWENISTEDLNQVLESSRPYWAKSFVDGLPDSVARNLNFLAIEPESEPPIAYSFWHIGTSVDNPLLERRHQLILKYASELQTNFRVKPDMELLTMVASACGPLIFHKDYETISSDQSFELERVKRSFLIEKLGLSDRPNLMEAINSVIDSYGGTEHHKYRAVICYMLLNRFFGKENSENVAELADNQRSKILQLLS